MRVGKKVKGGMEPDLDRRIRYDHPLELLDFSETSVGLSLPLQDMRSIVDRTLLVLRSRSYAIIVRDELKDSQYRDILTDLYDR